MGFHLQHMTGVLDRLFTYAHAQMLSADQLQYLGEEGKTAAFTSIELVEQLNRQINKAITLLSNIPAGALFEIRGVGRAQIPSTTLGLLVHAAEHTMRHLGQLLVTVKVLTAEGK